MKKLNHVHKFKRHKYKTGNAVYFCVLDCHFKIEVPLALGTKTLCNLCNEEFSMNEYTIKLARPHCEKCSKIKVSSPDGKKHFIRRDSLPVMASLANESVVDLRSHLDNTVTPTMDDDI